MARKVLLLVVLGALVVGGCTQPLDWQSTARVTLQIEELFTAVVWTAMEAQYLADPDSFEKAGHHWPDLVAQWARWSELRAAAAEAIEEGNQGAFASALIEMVRISAALAKSKADVCPFKN